MSDLSIGSACTVASSSREHDEIAELKEQLQQLQHAVFNQREGMLLKQVRFSFCSQCDSNMLADLSALVNSQDMMSQ